METKRIPFALVKRLSRTDADEAHEWWANLSHEDKRAVSGGVGRLRLLARHVEPDSMVELEEDIADINEYREENGLIWREKVHHICVAHPAARDAVSRGHLRASFQCPLASSTCPMRAILDEQPGCDVRFLRAPPT